MIFGIVWATWGEHFKRLLAKSTDHVRYFCTGLAFAVSFTLM